MSRTDKDVPYRVKAKRHGYRTHAELSVFTRTEKVVAVFYAHEVAEREAFEAECTESGFTTSCHEVTGYLADHPQRPLPRDVRQLKVGATERFVWDTPPTRDSIDPYVMIFAPPRRSSPKMNVFHVVTAVRTTTKEYQPPEYRLRHYQQGAWRCHCDYCMKPSVNRAAKRDTLRRELDEALHEEDGI